MVTATAPIQTHRGREQQPRSGDGPSSQADAGGTQRLVSQLGGSALALFGLANGSLGGLGLALLGGGLAYRSATGGRGVLSALGAKSTGGVHVEETVSILRPREELYRFWRNFENLPRFMHYLESVRSTDGNRSHWVARGPMNVRVEWDAEVTAERPNEQISWRSLPGSTVETEGSVTFQPEPANRGTRVKVVMRYDPPAGKVGAAMASLFGRSGEQESREDLRRFKRFMETGEIPTTKGQPTGRGGREAWEQTGSMVLEDRFASGLGWFSIGLGLAEMLAPEAMARLTGVPEQKALLRMLGAREIATGIGILSRPRPAGWLWGRVAGDAMDLTLLTAALLSPRSDRGRTAASAAAVIGVTALDLLCSLQQSSSPDFTGGDGHPRRGAISNGAHSERHSL
jgi:uncharacterized membrane protein